MVGGAEKPSYPGGWGENEYRAEKKANKPKIGGESKSPALWQQELKGKWLCVKAKKNARTEEETVERRKEGKKDLKVAKVSIV